LLACVRIPVRRGPASPSPIRDYSRLCGPLLLEKPPRVTGPRGSGVFFTIQRICLLHPSIGTAEEFPTGLCRSEVLFSEGNGIT